MKTVMSSAMVAHTWAHQTQDEAHNGCDSVFFKGKTIYSYRESWPLATHVTGVDGQAGVILNPDRCSNTTAHHLGMVRSSIPHELPKFYLPHTGEWKGYGNNAKPNHKDNLDGYRKRITEACAEITRHRKKMEWLNQVHYLVDEANAYCKFFGLKTRFTAPDLTEAEELARQQANQDRQRKERQERIQRQQLEAERAATMPRFEAWLAGEDVQFPQVWHERDNVRLRIKGNLVQTSLGAEFPLAHAPAILAIMRRAAAGGLGYTHNGHTLHAGAFRVNEITADHIKAGCHTVQRSEVERVAALAGL